MKLSFFISLLSTVIASQNALPCTTDTDCAALRCPPGTRTCEPAFCDTFICARPSCVSGSEQCPVSFQLCGLRKEELRVFTFSRLNQRFWR
ncbi:hypothetical protein GALMADRAFT_918680 [Galerina marginata CBS 339.88]|uniref:Uncharacterized protein n=1 Tax=Galerina marginata (strain CBS 339.88) TaxID=685588 RepID=A0A067SSE4_GALM3|nr:hypothetical protein GALMADRAFT_918680 [Galerina marginata CBS 339.88]